MTEWNDNRPLLASLRRRELASFVAGAMPVLAPGERYKDNFHVPAIAYGLEQAITGNVRRLLITCPPRHLKSTIASVCAPAWMLGRAPHKRIVCLSHTGELAAKHHDDCRRLMGSPYYRRLFPGALIAHDKNTAIEFRTSQGGGRISLSVGGPLTGRGGDIIIIDDPLKADDASSESRRKAVNVWFGETLASRLNDPKSGAIVLVMQRLHDDDLAGHVLEQGGWTVLSLPAIAEVDERIQIGPECFHVRREGELLHAERMGSEELDLARRQMGATAFSAQYQQRPAPLEGAVIKRAWLQRYAREPVRQKADRIVQSWDTGVKAGDRNDYSVCATFLRRGKSHYLLHVLRTRLEFPALLAKVIAHRRAFGPGPLLIEDAAAGAQIIQALKSQSAAPHAIAIKPEGDKFMRLDGQSHKFEAGDVLLPEAGAWLGDFEAELLAFPKGRYDDQVDAVSQYLRWADQRRTVRYGRVVGLT
ncbi:MAG: phage terminase large subunit [Phycisphaerales bacterium]|nr:phage terminase large subunit [Hyphomonadaceae bacterium]